MTTRPFAALVRKDLRLFLSDRRAVILSFIAPLVLASLFSMLAGGGQEGGSRIAVIVADADDSPLSRTIVAGLNDDPNLDLSAADPARAREMVRTGNAGVAVVIPAGFGAKATRGFFGDADKPEIAFLTDPTHAAESGMVRGLFAQQAMRAVSRDAFEGPGGLAAMDDLETRFASSSGMPPALRLTLKAMFGQIRKLREQTKDAAPASADDDGSGFGFSEPFHVKEETIAAVGQANQGIMAAHSFSGMAVQFILFASVEGGVGLLTERQKGLWRRVRSAPVSRLTILGSKAVSQSLIALAIVAVLFAFGALVYDVRFNGSFLGFVLVAIGYALTAATFGLLIAALGKTPQAARGISVMAVLLMVMLGGAWIPMFLFPTWLQKVTLVMPTRWAVDGFEGATWRGLGLMDLAPKALALLGFAAVFGLLAVSRFRWEED